MAAVDRVRQPIVKYLAKLFSGNSRGVHPPRSGGLGRFLGLEPFSKLWLNISRSPAPVFRDRRSGRESQPHRSTSSFRPLELRVPFAGRFCALGDTRELLHLRNLVISFFEAFGKNPAYKISLLRSLNREYAQA